MENQFDFDLMEDFMKLHRLLSMQMHLTSKSHGPFASPYSGQGRVLKLLALKPETTQKELAEILDMRPQSLGEILSKLEKNGYITRSQSKTDKRVMEVALTEKGKQASTVEIVDSAEQDFFNCLSDEEQTQLHAMLGRLIDHLETSYPQASCDKSHWFGRGRHHHNNEPSGTHCCKHENHAHHHGRHHLEEQHSFMSDYHDTVSHQHGGRKQTSDASTDIFSMIKETEAFCAASHYDLEQIHCNGCHNTCPLSQPRCGRGTMLQQKFQELQ